MWHIKHQPATLAGFVGNKTVVEGALKHDFGKPLLVYGASGSGKSVFARALAGDRGFEVVEVSDDNIEDAVKLSQTASLWGGRRMLLVDHAESVKDIKTVGELVKETKSPLVLLTSDLKSKRLATIKRSCVQLGLRKAHPASLAKYLGGVLAKEGVSAPPAVLEAVARNSGGDFRAALNDLETLAAGRASITEKDLEVVSARDTQADIYEVLSKIYKGEGSLREIYLSTMNLSEQPETVMLWIEENMPKAYASNASIRDAMHYISRADCFLGRIRRRQHWGFLRYASSLMTAGVSAVRPDKISYGRYEFPKYIIAMGRTRKDRALKKSIAKKMGPAVHASGRVVADQYIPLYRQLVKSGTLESEELAEHFKLNEEETEFIAG